VTLRIRRVSLRTRIIAWSFIPTAIILFAVALVAFYAYRRVTEELVVGRNRELIRLAASQLNADLRGYVDVLAVLSRNADIYDPDKQDETLQRFKDRLVVLDAGVLILDPYGRVTAAQPERPDALGQDWSDRSYFRHLVRTRTLAFSDTVTDGPQGAQVVAVGMPIITDKDEFKGAVVGMFRLGRPAVSAFYGGIIKLRIAENGTIFLMDSSGRAVYHSDADRIGRPVDAPYLPTQGPTRQADALRTTNLDGREILASSAPVPGTPWLLGSEEDWDGLLASSRGYSQFLVFLLALGLVVPTLVVIVGVRRITGPIARLIEAAKEVAGGRFDQKIALHTGDELEELVKQFNIMSSRVMKSYATLERRVEERTHELERRRQVAEALRDMLAILNSNRLLDEILDAIVVQACRLLGCDAIALFELDRKTDLLSIRASQDLDVDYVAGMMMPVGKGAAGQAVQNRQPVTLQDSAAMLTMLDPAEHPPERWALMERIVQSYRSLFAAPLITKDEAYGALVLYYRTERAFSDEEIALVLAFANQAALAIDNAALRAHAERSAVAAERDRMARELHDSVTQSIYSVNLYAEAAARLLLDGRAPEAAEHLRELRDTAQEALREMRLMIFELRPLALEKGGLVAALRARLDAVEVRGGVQAELKVEGVQGAEHLSTMVQEELYHIAQETLNNTLKHANASHVKVLLQFQETVTHLEICDDGAGFALDAASGRGGFGLHGMQERAQRIAGKLNIESAPGKGTTVRVEVPASAAAILAARPNS
jgi:signal transduction histidine kinase